MRSVNLSRATLAVLIVALLAGGVAVGTAFSVLGREAASTPTPTPSAAISPSATATPGLPSADVDGEDLSRLPRYSGSVRSDYRIEGDDRFRLTVTEYLADARIDAVRQFYQRVIVEHGWQRADVAYHAGEWTYILVDGAVEALIEIEEVGGLIEIDLQLSEPIPAPAASPTPRPTSAPPPPPPPDDNGDDDDDDDGDTDDDEGGDTDG